MQGWIDASYFHPPAADAAPSWVILNKKARCTNCDNATTASAITRSGHTVKVTFCLVSPPSASHVCVFYTYTEPRCEDPYLVRAEVASSAKDLVLLRCETLREPDAEYFVYHAAC